MQFRAMPEDRRLAVHESSDTALDLRWFQFGSAVSTKAKQPRYRNVIIEVTNERPGKSIIWLTDFSVVAILIFPALDKPLPAPELEAPVEETSRKRKRSVELEDTNDSDSGANTVPRDPGLPSTELQLPLR